MNPLINNSLQTRQDFVESVRQLWSPLKPFFDEGGARVCFGNSAAVYSKTVSEMESFSRPLYGLAPLQAGGFDFEDWPLIRKGLADGVNPDSKDYWGSISNSDQRIVETSAIALGLIFAKEHLWDALEIEDRDNVATWLKIVLTKRVGPNNWQFFPVLASLALEHCGIEHDLSFRTRALDKIEEYYVADGWYSDGKNRRYDHYVAFAFHFYGLIYAKLVPEDKARTQRFRQRAREFAQQFRHWFDSEGRSVPYGRSMTYRFAQAAFWGALAFADEEALPWGEIRGIWARHLRWWGKQDYFDRNGVPSIGYCYPNQNVAESYNAPGSPNWSWKAFLPLALKADHPFWQAEETEKEVMQSPVNSDVSGTLVFGTPKNQIMLVSCSEMKMPLREGAPKYAKFAYSSAFGFSVEHGHDTFLVNPFDNSLAFSENCRTYSVRAGVEEARIGEDWIYSKWFATSDIGVETLILAQAPWHWRMHRIVSYKPVYVFEGGFAIEQTDRVPREELASKSFASIETEIAKSVSFDASDIQRVGRVLSALPNTSLYFPRTYIPQLCCKIEPGEVWLVGAFACAQQGEDMGALEHLPDAPCRMLMNEARKGGRRVKGLNWCEPDLVPDI